MERDGSGDNRPDAARPLPRVRDQSGCTRRRVDVDLVARPAPIRCVGAARDVPSPSIVTGLSGIFGQGTAGPLCVKCATYVPPGTRQTSPARAPQSTRTNGRRSEPRRRKMELPIALIGPNPSWGHEPSSVRGRESTFGAVTLAQRRSAANRTSFCRTPRWFPQSLTSSTTSSRNTVKPSLKSAASSPVA